MVFSGPLKAKFSRISYKFSLILLQSSELSVSRSQHLLAVQHVQNKLQENAARENPLLGNIGNMEHDKYSYEGRT